MYCTLLGSKLSLRETYSLFFTVGGATPVLTICSLCVTSTQPNFMMAIGLSGEVIVDTLMRAACVPEVPLKVPHQNAGSLQVARAQLRPWLDALLLYIGDTMYHRQRTLGNGISGRVSAYANRLDLQDEIAVKTPKLDHETAIQHEREILAKLAEHVKNEPPEVRCVIPQLVAYPAGQPLDDKHLCMRPVCESLQLTVDNYPALLHDLVTAIFIAAQCSIVHRDVRVANIMASNGHAVLLDWAFAVSVDVASGTVSAFYEGTVSTASQRVLQSLRSGQSTVEVGFADDAQSLVKAVWRMGLQLSKLHVPPPHVEPVVDNAARWHQWWENVVAQHSTCREAEQAALGCRRADWALYVELERSLTTMFRKVFVL